MCSSVMRFAMRDFSNSRKSSDPWIEAFGKAAVTVRSAVRKDLKAVHAHGFRRFARVARRNKRGISGHLTVANESLNLMQCEVIRRLVLDRPVLGSAIRHAPQDTGQGVWPVQCTALYTCGAIRWIFAASRCAGSCFMKRTRGSRENISQEQT